MKKNNYKSQTNKQSVIRKQTFPIDTLLLLLVLRCNDRKQKHSVCVYDLFFSLSICDNDDDQIKTKNQNLIYIKVGKETK